MAEASTKCAILIVVSSEVVYYARTKFMLRLNYVVPLSPHDWNDEVHENGRTGPYKDRSC
jgi:hypothetical protein